MMFERPLEDEVKSLIRDVPDFPKPGILFKDIAPMMQSGPAFMRVVDHFKARYAGRSVQRIVAIESRGFLFGSALAYALGLGVSLVRKPGKLPWRTERQGYTLEYGDDAVEMHVDAVSSGQQVVVFDDLLATGGTAAATVDLVKRLGATVVECAFVIELAFLDGRSRLDAPSVYSLVTY